MKKKFIPSRGHCLWGDGKIKICKVYNNTSGSKWCCMKVLSESVIFVIVVVGGAPYNFPFANIYS